jgi:signal transduction histidine kinase
VSELAGRKPSGAGSFRLKLLVGMMLVVSAVTGLAMYVASRSIAANAELDLEREFKSEIAALRRSKELRHAALAERCRALVRRPRIHAALEDNALDLLYLSARDELRDVMTGDDEESLEPGTHALHARFYRFLDGAGAVIPPGASGVDVGALKPEEEGLLALKSLPKEQQLGCLVQQTAHGLMVDEIIAMPIISSETGEVISAIVLGFKPLDVMERAAGIRSGFFADGSIHVPGVSGAGLVRLNRELVAAMSASADEENRLTITYEGTPHLLFYQRGNPGSMFPAFYEVSVFPLTDSLARQRQWRWQIGVAGMLLMLGGLVLSHYMAGNLAAPVDRLVVDSQEQREQRVKAEAALELTHAELQRAARFSSDASHQLKTPVTVLRAGLEELLTKESLDESTREDVSGLIHQTFRLTSMIQDLLLLSRMDEGRLRLNLTAVDLTQLIEASADDLTALPDDLEVRVETDIPAQLMIVGEKAYTALILQNLLENARKYNRPAGRIRIQAEIEGETVKLRIGNTGKGIPASAQAHIFERFHRATAGENIPGHGLGLNLARELALLHGGDLRLISSENDWTEFEVCFRSSAPDAVPRSELA